MCLYRYGTARLISHGFPNAIGTRAGPIVDFRSNEVLGTHDGFWFHTVGQRKGLRLSGGPWYVVSKDIHSNTVFVSPSVHDASVAVIADEDHHDEFKDSFEIGEVNWISGFAPDAIDSEAGVRLEVKVRHGARKHECVVMSNASLYRRRHGAIDIAARLDCKGDADEGRFRVFVYESDLCVAPGQYAALYRDGECLGSGAISERLRWEGM